MSLKGMSLLKRIGVAGGTAVLGVGAALATTQGADASSHTLQFHMVRSAGAVTAKCIPHASAAVTIKSTGPVEVMDVNLSGLPKKTDFDFFVLQVPNKPFGVSWYQGDIETDSHGKGHGHFVGRFNIETFAVAPGVAKAPVTQHGSASSNPAFNPIQMYHLGLWFNSPKDANKAGCGSAVTPFNGEHNAGAQALSTRNFTDAWGPLRKLG